MGVRAVIVSTTSASPREAREVRAALGVATAWGYVQHDAVTGALQEIDRVLAMLWRLTH